ncbi:GFA family protein [Pseudomonas typographi]|uniref:GFA family protein n=1 Tax=Pseudomonas typographi TaxID=2715964 RepID=A0ABR7Z8A1_9PSED|nr:GFA family protein [Pseudomonas typographi]MBD1551899.1 GFA family protein [Pseudomonas typographi]MBD1589850.1 GFA family protein [Pseudomonas typographi]MBD1601553.1 GFA family protein [Pseudomonas typographi]
MKGSCLCGALRYEVEVLGTAIVHCHCRTCRKAHGAAFSSNAQVAREAFRWLGGQQALACFEPAPGVRRYFCRQCGSPLLAEREGEAQLLLKVASLDDDPGVLPYAHIWTDHDVPWLESCGGQMYHQGLPPEA